MENFDLVASLQALPESNPVEIDGLQFGSRTCQSVCMVLTVNVLQTILIGGMC